MTIRFPLKNLPLHTVGRGPGFSAAVLAIARREESDLLIESEDWQRLTREHLVRLPVKPPASSGLGDLVHAIAHPIARALDATLGTNLQNCSACAQRRETLNRW